MKKRYYNSSTKEWYTEGNSLTRRVNGALFSGIPSVEQLYEWGFEEIIEPPYVPTEEELLQEAKQRKIAELMAYDGSEAVNSFDVNVGGKSMSTWLTPEQRADYKNSLDSAEILGMTEVSPVLNGITLNIDIQTAKMALAKIQIYANQCYGVTAMHKAAINALETVEEVEAYDFTMGYPHRLIFEI